MKKVVFVGDQPSQLNTDKTVPFVGAKSFRRLVHWINFIDPDYYIVLNSADEADIQKIVNLHYAGFKVVALGKEAAKRVPTGVNYASLPHPSGRNLQVNDIVEICAALSKVKEYVNKEAL